MARKVVCQPKSAGGFNIVDKPFTLTGFTISASPLLVGPSSSSHSVFSSLVMIRLQFSLILIFIPLTFCLPSILPWSINGIY